MPTHHTRSEALSPPFSTDFLLGLIGRDVVFAGQTEVAIGGTRLIDMFAAGTLLGVESTDESCVLQIRTREGELVSVDADTLLGVVTDDRVSGD